MDSHAVSHHESQCGGLGGVQVYAWFLGSHKASVGLGVAGYALLLVELLGGGPALAVLLPPGTSLLVLWYGLYFGVLGRDVAEVAADGMVPPPPFDARPPPPPPHTHNTHTHACFGRIEHLASGDLLGPRPSAMVRVPPHHPCEASLLGAYTNPASQRHASPSIGLAAMARSAADTARWLIRFASNKVRRVRHVRLRTECAAAALSCCPDQVELHSGGRAS